MKNDSGGKKYILNIEQKAVKIIIFIFSIIIIVVFGAGYFMGKTVSLKNSRIENQSNVLYKITPADTVGLSTVTAQIEKSVPTDKKKDNNQETDKIAAVNKPEIQDDVKTGTDKSKIKESSQSKKNSSKSKSQKKNKEYIIEVYAYKTSKEA
ncbi:hypothetical protein KA977_12240, partial [Candidatus Dependentiae bacterium]|nr:hypothetical protein [Candidatus Dependentiae bacterium]